MSPAPKSYPGWTEALTAQDLCGCAARFLAGDLGTFPGWGAPDVDEETDPLIPTLELCCRAGFLTVASQPGGDARIGADGRTEQRRAFVTGFASPRAVERLRANLPQGLSLFSHPSSLLDLDLGLIVGERGGETFLLAGAAAGPIELDFFRQAASPVAAEDLAQWSFTSLIEDDWNRDDRLWDHLDRALQ